MVWIFKGVYYPDKYGFGYQLSDDIIDVIPNDWTLTAGVLKVNKF